MVASVGKWEYRIDFHVLYITKAGTLDSLGHEKYAEVVGVTTATYQEGT